MNAFFKRIEQPRYKLVLVLVLVAFAFALGYLLRGGTSQTAVPESEEQPEEAKVEVWTCAMHPQIRQPKPGKCPICGMDLVAATSAEVGSEHGVPRELTLSSEAIALAEIEVVPVERKIVSAQIRMVGKIDYDETRLAYITARFPGRLDRLYVDYTGMPVRKGDHMAVIYSPELLTAQAELVQALRTVKELAGSDLPSIKETALETVEAAREKLRLWGLTTEQIEEIQTRGTPSDHMTIYAPMSGIVIHKNAVDGMYIDTGGRIYTIADLSQVWARLDAYESDIVWLKYGQDVALETESYPGEVFTGKIAFIDPVFDAKTRTVKVRVNLPNPDGRLMPEMFVRAVVRSEVAAGGKVVEPDLMGKWMCPMHPEIVKGDPGTCDICEMPLAKTESLGYVSADAFKGDVAPLVIPASAPLITGERAVVYVQVPDKDGVFEGREIVLGPRAGDYYIVDEGLDEGELVVVNGNFKIDSALQILAKPSMMSPEGGAPAPGHHHGAAMPSAPVAKKVEVPTAFQAQLRTLYEAYLKLQDALAGDSQDKAVEAVKGFRGALTGVDMKLLKGQAHVRWMRYQANIAKTIQGMAYAGSIEAIRAGFAPMSEEMAAIIRAFGIGIEQPIYVLKCPMAFDGRGARWLQKSKDTRNPYFGAAMLQCGTVVETISSGTSQSAGDYQHE